MILTGDKFAMVSFTSGAQLSIFGLNMNTKALKRRFTHLTSAARITCSYSEKSRSITMMKAMGRDFAAKADGSVRFLKK